MVRLHPTHSLCLLVSPARTSRQPNKATATIISFSVKCLQASSSRQAAGERQPASKPASQQASKPASQQPSSRQAAGKQQQQQTANSSKQQIAVRPSKGKMWDKFSFKCTTLHNHLRLRLYILNYFESFWLPHSCFYNRCFKKN